MVVVVTRYAQEKELASALRLELARPKLIPSVFYYEPPGTVRVRHTNQTDRYELPVYQDTRPKVIESVVPFAASDCYQMQPSVMVTALSYRADANVLC